MNHKRNAPATTNEKHTPGKRGGIVFNLTFRSITC